MGITESVDRTCGGKKDADFEQENVYYCKDKSQILRKQH